MRGNQNEWVLVCVWERARWLYICLRGNNGNFPFCILYTWITVSINRRSWTVIHSHSQQHQKHYLAGWLIRFEWQSALPKINHPMEKSGCFSSVSWEMYAAQFCNNAANMRRKMCAANTNPTKIFVYRMCETVQSIAKYTGISILREKPVLMMGAVAMLSHVFHSLSLSSVCRLFVYIPWR